MKRGRKVWLALAVVLLVSVLALGMWAKVRALADKEYLTGQDLALALQSKGMAVRQVRGDFGELSRLQKEPEIYHIQGATLLVYAYDDAFERRFDGMCETAEVYERVLGVPVQDIWINAVKNMVIVALTEESVDWTRRQVEKAIDERLCRWQESTLQKEVDGVRFTIKQRYYCQTMRDGRNDCDLLEYKTDCQLSCAYVKPQPLEEQPFSLSIATDGLLNGWEDVWDGQETLEMDYKSSRCLVKKTGAMPIYDVTFAHGNREVAVQIGQND